MPEEKNKHILDFFIKAKESQKLAHGYLFWGPDSPVNSQENEEKTETALWLAKYLNVGQFDILRVSVAEDKKEISISQIRAVRKHLSLSSYGGGYKFAIINKAEKMNSEAANALLKTLEEPQGNTILVLITSAPELLPKTILSRLEVIRFKPVSLNQIYKNFLNKEYIDLLQKPLNDIFKRLEEATKDETETVPLLDCWLFFFRDLLINRSATDQQKNKFTGIIKEIQKIKNLISSTNINQRLALENLILCIKS